mmetsp:Transcript_125342/g.348774  ORF Transcript_125342/g.348774 Transcript_125342/m.348774 type:complete len:186 (+) Transcript_125342:117-674(+)
MGRCTSISNSGILLAAWLLMLHLAAAEDVAAVMGNASGEVDTAADTAPATGTFSGVVDGEPILRRSVNTTKVLRHDLSRLLLKSTEEMKSLKSLLTTNAKGTKAMNEMLLEMERLTARMDKFTGSMEKCRQQIVELEAQDASILTPQEADDPLLGATTLLQLHGHVDSLRAHMRQAREDWIHRPA